MSGRRRGRRHGYATPSAVGPLPEEVAVASAIEIAVADETPEVIPVQIEFDGQASRPICTAAQMRRFIKSRPYVPLHELRRRFGIEGSEDEVFSFEAPGGPLYVGLPPREAQLLGELVRSGEVGYELLLDPTCPAIVGVFPMKPVARTN